MSQFLTREEITQRNRLLLKQIEPLIGQFNWQLHALQTLGVEVNVQVVKDQAGRIKVQLALPGAVSS